MLIITPEIFTDMLLEEVNVDGSVAEEILRKMTQNLNWIYDLVPIGEVIYVNVNAQNVPQPDSKYFQICDGEEITNPLSPLRTDPNYPSATRHVPDLRNCYARFSNDGTSKVVNSVTPSGDGSQYHNIAHGHQTGGGGGGGSLDSDNERREAPPHSHSTPTAWGSNHLINAPAYIYVTAYMKVA